MARKSKLSNEQFNEFLRDRAGGMRLLDCQHKYGLTQARLSQIYRKWQAIELAVATRDSVEVVEVESEEERYQRIEKEHFGDAEKKTGIYAERVLKDESDGV